MKANTVNIYDDTIHWIHKKTWYLVTVERNINGYKSIKKNTAFWIGIYDYLQDEFSHKVMIFQMKKFAIFRK